MQAIQDCHACGLCHGCVPTQFVALVVVNPQCHRRRLQVPLFRHHGSNKLAEGLRRSRASVSQQSRAHSSSVATNYKTTSTAKLVRVPKFKIPMLCYQDGEQSKVLCANLLLVSVAGCSRTTTKSAPVCEGSGICWSWGTEDIRLLSCMGSAGFAPASTGLSSLTSCVSFHCLEDALSIVALSAAQDLPCQTKRSR